MTQSVHSERSVHTRPLMWLVGLLAALLVLLWWGGESVTQALRYERDFSSRGEYWRLLTGHLVHGSSQHLALNVIGLALIGALFPREYTWRDWLVIAALSVVAIDVGFVWYEPQLQWYVGLSGVLHGALAAGAVAWWQSENRLLALLLSAVLVGKLAWEQSQGALPLSGDLPVVVDAHLYGAAGGAAAALGLRILRRGWPSRRRSI